MKRSRLRWFIGSITSIPKPLCLATAALSITLAVMSTSVASQPNVLLIIADDQTWHDAGCYGNEVIQTPNIDRLAEQGMRFTHCFTATAMCAPTRQQLYTSVFPVRNGAYPNHSRVYDGVQSIVHHLGDLGYRVGLSGKEHFKPKESFPFEKVARKQISEFLTRDREQPFCLVYASNSPHLPWTAGDASQYDPDRMPLPPYLVDTPETRVALTKYYAEITDFDREVGQCMKLLADAEQEENTIFIYTSEQGAQFPRGKWTCYDTGLKTNLVVRWPAKVEPGSVTDAMVQYVDILPTLIEAAGGDPSQIDTGIGGAAGGSNGFDGKSFLGVLTGEKDEHNDVVFGAHTTRGITQGSESYPIRSIRTRTHKLIWNLQHDAAFRNVLQTGDGGNYWKSWLAKAETDPVAKRFVEGYIHRPEFELYNVANDPYELDNLASRDELKVLQAELHGQLKAWMEQQGDEGIATEMKARQRQGRRNR